MSTPLPQLVEGSRVARLIAQAVEQAKQEAYEQAAQWCVERAEKMETRASVMLGSWAHPDIQARGTATHEAVGEQHERQ